jgi:malonate decarboxylase gamma subunit
MNTESVLEKLFPQGYDTVRKSGVITGRALVGSSELSILGTVSGSSLNESTALTLSRSVLQTVRDASKRPMLFLVDWCSEVDDGNLDLRELTRSLAHLASCVDLARRSGFPSISIAVGDAAGSAYLSYGLMADRAFAIADASVRFMGLAAIAEATSLSHELLTQFAVRSPIIAPGVENYWRIGALDAVWSHPTPLLLKNAIEDISDSRDRRSAQGVLRGGRTEAARIAATVNWSWSAFSPEPAETPCKKPCFFRRLRPDYSALSE